MEDSEHCKNSVFDTGRDVARDVVLWDESVNEKINKIS